MFKSRNKNIFFAALISIFIGTMILNLSGGTLSNAGAFSLSEYNSLNSVKSVISSYNSEMPGDWDGIGTQNIVMHHESSPGDAKSHYNAEDFHFIVCDGVIGDNGQIIATENWKNQFPIPPWQWQGSDRNIIRIGIIVDSIDVGPTEVQSKRANLLAWTLARKLSIKPITIFTPFF